MRNAAAMRPTARILALYGDHAAGLSAVSRERTLRSVVTADFTLLLIAPSAVSVAERARGEA